TRPSAGTCDGIGTCWARGSAASANAHSTILIGMVASHVAPFRTPEPPVFSSLSEERQHRKERLAASFRLFSRFGFEQGVAGHITARDPELTDHFWVNPDRKSVVQV